MTDDRDFRSDNVFWFAIALPNVSRPGEWLRIMWAFTMTLWPAKPARP